VVGATTWIRRLKTEANLQLNGVQRAIVVGGGNTAVDATRELAGLGVGSVTLVYRRSRADMKAYDHELTAALREGVELRENSILTEVLRQGAKLTGVRLQDQTTLAVDLVVVAIGQAKLRALVEQFPGVACDDRGRIVADPKTFVTGNPRVFTGGDAMNGGLEVVNAVHDGQAAAGSIDALLRNPKRPSGA
jgi:glutamate synthase (NADPH/NADH) small chain